MIFTPWDWLKYTLYQSSTDFNPKYEELHFLTMIRLQNFSNWCVLARSTSYFTGIFVKALPRKAIEPSILSQTLPQISFQILKEERHPNKKLASMHRFLKMKNFTQGRFVLFIYTKPYYRKNAFKNKNGRPQKTFVMTPTHPRVIGLL